LLDVLKLAGLKGKLALDSLLL